MTAGAGVRPRTTTWCSWGRNRSSSPPCSACPAPASGLGRGRGATAVRPITGSCSHRVPAGPRRDRGRLREDGNRPEGRWHEWQVRTSVDFCHGDSARRSGPDLVHRWAQLPDRAPPLPPAAPHRASVRRPDRRRDLRRALDPPSRAAEPGLALRSHYRHARSSAPTAGLTRRSAASADAREPDLPSTQLVHLLLGLLATLVVVWVVLACSTGLARRRPIGEAVRLIPTSSASWGAWPVIRRSAAVSASGLAAGRALRPAHRPDAHFIPVLGYADDVVITARAARRRAPGRSRGRRPPLAGTDAGLHTLGRVPPRRPARH